MKPLRLPKLCTWPAERAPPVRIPFLFQSIAILQTIEVVKTRAWPLGVEVVVGDHTSFEPHDGVFGVLLQYPTTDGDVLDYRPFVSRAKEAGSLVVVAADLMAWPF